MVFFCSSSASRVVTVTTTSTASLGHVTLDRTHEPKVTHGRVWSLFCRRLQSAELGKS